MKNNADYMFSSYNFYSGKYGEDFLSDAEREYPIADFTVENDE